MSYNASMDILMALINNDIKKINGLFTVDALRDIMENGVFSEYFIQNLLDACRITLINKNKPIIVDK